LALLHVGREEAVGLALLAVMLATKLLAAMDWRSTKVTNPVAVKDPVIVGVAMEGLVASTIVPPLPVTAHPEIAVPFPCRQGAVTVVEIVIAGVDVGVATVPAKPFPEVTDALVTVPDPLVVIV
jgi:hypothetical protein